MLKRATVNGSPRYVVLTVDFQFTLGSLSSPIKYAELAKSLGVEPGQRADSALVRQKVLELRGSKGMVLNPEDRDTFSTGSFFTNPIVPRSTLESLPEGAPNFPVITKVNPFGQMCIRDRHLPALHAGHALPQAGRHDPSARG